MSASLRCFLWRVTVHAHFDLAYKRHKGFVAGLVVIDTESSRTPAHPRLDPLPNVKCKGPRGP